MILPPNAARSERRGDEISMCPLARRQAVKYKALPLEVIKMIELLRPKSEDLSRTLKVEELMPILRIGRNTAYELVRSGQIRSIRIGRSYRIPKGAIEEYLQNKTE